MVAGWWVAFRNRTYLLLLGIFFLFLAASLIVGDRLQTGELGVAWRNVVRVTLTLSLLSLLAAVVAAVQETRQRLREVRQHYQAATEALLEITRAQELKRQQAQEQQSEATQDAPPGDEQP